MLRTEAVHRRTFGCFLIELAGTRRRHAGVKLVCNGRKAQALRAEVKDGAIVRRLLFTIHVPSVAQHREAQTVSNLTQAQRDKLPLSAFGYPEKRLYPILDASDVRAAASLIGKAPADVRDRIKARVIAIAKRKGFPIPKAWQDSTN